MPEPEVGGTERFGFEVFAFGEFFNDGRRKTGAADAGEQSYKAPTKSQVRVFRSIVLAESMSRLTSGF